jgi:hypothetical protein
MKVIKFKGMNNSQVIKYLNDGGNEIKPKYFRSRIDKIVKLDFDTKYLKIKDGVFSENIEDKIKEEKNNRIKIEKDKVNKDVYDEMINIFNTPDKLNSIASFLTVEAMLKRPENFIDASIGFNDKASVLSYASEKIAEYDAYGLFRFKRISEFKTKKEDIINE